MGVLIEGVWRDEELPQEVGRAGEFRRAGRDYARGHSVKAAIFDRLTEADVAPFKNLDPDPGPKVQELLRAA